MDTGQRDNGASQPHLTAPDMSEHMRPPHRTPSRTRRAFWFLVVLVLCALLLGGFWGFEQFKQKMIGQFFASMKQPPTPVEVYKAATQSMPRRLESIGTLTAVHQVTVSPEVAGRVVAIKFESGATVKAGDVLAQLDDATERADLATYQAQAHLAQVNLARQQKLAQNQFSTKASIDQLKSELDQANAGIMRSQATIQYKVIKAPFAGVLGIRQINLGQYLAAGTAMVTLTDLDNLYVDFTLPEQDRSQLVIGQDVEVRVDAFPDRVFMAELTTIDPQVDPTMRAVQLRATLSNPDHALQPGMYGRVAVVLPSEPDVVTIPEVAIDYTVYGDSVFVLHEAKKNDTDSQGGDSQSGDDQGGDPENSDAKSDGQEGDSGPQYTVEQVFVTTGARSGGKVGITKGVQAGDLVVVGGQLKLHNGADVTISKDRSLENPETMPVE